MSKRSWLGAATPEFNVSPPVSATETSESKFPFPWKYNEGALLEEFGKYLEGTYGEHYVSGDGKIQEFDVMEADGELEIFAKQSARKYLRRYGKKLGRNRKDLLKVLHYTVILLYLLDKDKATDLRNIQVTNCYFHSSNL